MRSSKLSRTKLRGSASKFAQSLFSFILFFFFLVQKAPKLQLHSGGDEQLNYVKYVSEKGLCTRLAQYSLYRSHIG
jgi:hypothetical protein